VFGFKRGFAKGGSQFETPLYGKGVHQIEAPIAWKHQAVVVLTKAKRTQKKAKHEKFVGIFVGICKAPFM